MWCTYVTVGWELLCGDTGCSGRKYRWEWLKDKLLKIWGREVRQNVKYYEKKGPKDERDGEHWHGYDASQVGWQQKGDAVSETKILYKVILIYCEKCGLHLK